MEHDKAHSAGQAGKQYWKLFLMAAISYIAMYLLMYAMVDSIENVLPNVNQLYMAALMTSPMIIIELLLMGSMYPAKRWNAAILVVSVCMGVISFLMIREQTAVSDRQFLRSMVPHHAAAVLMVKKADIRDPQIKALADSIIAAQQREIRFMKQKLEEIGHK